MNLFEIIDNQFKRPGQFGWRYAFDIYHRRLSASVFSKNMGFFCAQFYVYDGGVLIGS